MAKTAQSTKKIVLKPGEKFDTLTSFYNFEGLGEENFKVLERGQDLSVDELTPELDILIKSKKIATK